MKLASRCALIGVLLLLLTPRLIPQEARESEDTGAAEGSQALLAFYQDTSGELRIVSPDGSRDLHVEELELGEPLPVGWTLVTGDGDSAELQLLPSGTMIRIAENTNFRVSSLGGGPVGAEPSSFELGFGKFRAVTGGLAGERAYEFRGRHSVCGVRGTDFGMQRLVVGTEEVEEAFVFEGEISLALEQTGEQITVSGGEYAVARPEDFRPRPMPDAKSGGLLAELAFESPGKAGAPEIEPEVEEPAEPERFGTRSDEGESSEELSERRLEFLSMELGSLTIGDDTYAKVALTPTFGSESFELGLYLPLIYQASFLDPGDWYRPRGNNEWSFGTDQDGGLWEVLADIGVDLALKIRHMRIGRPSSPFYLRAGNLHDITLGHGVFMRGFANDLEFPAIRRIGVDIRGDFGNAGFQTVLSDLTEPEIFGARIFSRPAAPAVPLGIGLSGVVDLEPAGDLPESTADAIGDPALLAFGLDLDWPFVRDEERTVMVYTDLTGSMPYFRSGGAGAFSGVSSGPAWDSLISFDPFGFPNFGLAAGVLGRVGGFEWRAEYTVHGGYFLPGFLNLLYERNRLYYAVRAASFAADPSGEEFSKTSMGALGEIGFISEGGFFVKAGYLLPFSLSSAGFAWEELDWFHLSVGLEKGGIDGFPLGFELSYERNYLKRLLFHGKTEDGAELGLFDWHSAARAGLIYGPSETIDVRVSVGTALGRDEAGQVLYDGMMEPEIVPTLSLETHIHF